MVAALAALFCYSFSKFVDLKQPFLKEAISLFHPVSLADMDKVSLMDRKDTKFLFRPERLPVLFKELSKYYYILEIENNRAHHYASLYFDTDHFKFYLDHHNGKMNRYKVRHRKYINSQTHFVEVKFKNNQGKTRKRRMKIEPSQFQQTNLSVEEEAFVLKRMSGYPGNLSPKLFVEYSRWTLVDKEFRERATIDINLTYSAKEKEKKMLGNIVIAEVKQDKLSISSDFIRIMRKMRIQDARFSKYCFGINLLYPMVKYNRFKPRILAYNKLVS